jgi:hypothetical protein
MFSFAANCRKLRGHPSKVTVNIMNTALQSCPPWTIRSWPPLLWQLGKQIPLRFHHIGTQITSGGSARQPSLGQTLWASAGEAGEAGEVGMAWDWVQLPRGVLALADPMAVVTNLRLVGQAGQVLDPYESALHINVIVQGLPWQQAVQSALDTAAPPSHSLAPPLRH